MSLLVLSEQAQQAPIHYVLLSRLPATPMPHWHSNLRLLPQAPLILRVCMCHHVCVSVCVCMFMYVCVLPRLSRPRAGSLHSASRLIISHYSPSLSSPSLSSPSLSVPHRLTLYLSIGLCLCTCVCGCAFVYTCFVFHVIPDGNSIVLMRLI